MAPSSRWMSCLTTSATRRSRIVPAAALIASAAASSQDVLLVPMTSVTLYTLTTFSLRVAVHLRSEGLPRPGSVLLSQAEPGTSLRRRPDRAWLSALLEDG